MEKKRQAWGSKLGIILAVAGSAVGLGNFLRFPVQAAQNGGGAFMIPYFVSLLFLGIPLMWVEWAIGRYGGGFEHSTAPGIFHSLWEKNKFIKYFGVIGIFGPTVIFIYYTYVESWTLAYSFFAATGKYNTCINQVSLVNFLKGFQGLEKNQYFSSLAIAYTFFLITFFANIIILYYGIKGGIEKLCKIAMPVLFIFAGLVVVRVLTLPHAFEGLGYLWNPDFSALKSSRTWLAAAGQIFFTLSVGIGVILTYASYLKKTDDVTLSGLTAVSTNEFAEVILGGSIVIPAAFAFFGPQNIAQIAKQGAFNLSFVTMPAIFINVPWGALFGFFWFFMLFLAGITSSVSLAQPAIAFLEDEFNLSRKKAICFFGVATFLLMQPSIFLLGSGVVDELDFWGGTFCLVVFATVEIILFSWVFGIDKAWDHMHHGAMLKIPKIYKYIIKYVTPLFLLFILGFWFVQDAIPVIIMKGVPEANRNIVLGTRMFLITIFTILCILVKIAWKKRKARTYH